jgi:hypothetical protein
MTTTVPSPTVAQHDHHQDEPATVIDTSQQVTTPDAPPAPHTLPRPWFAVVAIVEVVAATTAVSRFGSGQVGSAPSSSWTP